jgi:hypothetical protein
MEERFGVRGKFTSPLDYEFSNGFFLGGALSRELVDVGGVVALEAEAGLGQRFGTLHETEVWGAVICAGSIFLGTILSSPQSPRRGVNKQPCVLQ